MMASLGRLIRRDLLLAWRRPADALGSVFFFVMVCSLFPLGLGPEPDLLRTLAPGVLWVAALLATLLGLPRLFAADHADGTLEQMLLLPQPTLLLVLAKTLAHWLLFGAPLLLLAPLLALQYGLPLDAIQTLLISLALGTPSLSLIGAIAAALTLASRGGGILLSLLLLPLYIPVLVFAAGAVGAQQAGLSATAHLQLLAALGLLCLVLAPGAAAAGLRVAIE